MHCSECPASPSPLGRGGAYYRQQPFSYELCPPGHIWTGLFGILLQDLHDLSPTVTARWSAKLAIIADRSSIDTWL